MTDHLPVEVLQWRALDLLTAKHGRTYIVPGEECYLYVSESGPVEQNVQMLKDIQ